jgi:nitrile hydratase accessory protein
MADMLRASPEDAPPFPAPWAAEVFALTVHLHERHVFTWPQWVEALSTELHKPGKHANGDDYFQSWVEALCALLGALNILQPAEVTEMKERWQRAAEATPHGQPISLDNASPTTFARG